MDVENAAQGIQECDTIWLYDADSGYAGMKEWAELLLAERERLRADLAQALKLLAESEDAQWEPGMKDYLRSHGYVENDKSPTGWDEPTEGPLWKTGGKS